MQIDTVIYQLSSKFQSPALTTFSKIIAFIFEPISIAIISILISTYLFYKNKKSRAILFASTIIATGIIIKILKEIFERQRPISSLIQETGFSFPSGHATISVVFLGLLIYIFGNKTNKIKTIIASTLIITIVALTRIYLQVHWLTDTIAGIIIGAIILTTAILINKKFTSSN